METEAKLVFDAPWPRASKYFQTPRMEGSGRGSPSSGNLLACQSEQQLSPESLRVEIAKKTKTTLHEAICKSVNKEPWQGTSAPRLYTQQASHTTMRGSGEALVFKKDTCRSDLGKFAANISHIDEFGRIAKNSVDKFSQSIAPFRCSTGKGARASGLRAPMKSISHNASKGSVGSGQSTIEDCLKQYSYQPTKFGPSSEKLPYSHSNFAATNFVQNQGSDSSLDWPMTGEI